MEIDQEIADFQRMANLEMREQQDYALNKLREFLTESSFTPSDFIMVVGETMDNQIICSEITVIDEDQIGFTLKRFACTTMKKLEDETPLLVVTETYNDNGAWENSFLALQGQHIKKIYYVENDMVEFPLPIFLESDGDNQLNES